MKNDNHVWDNKHPTAQMLGRWQPWHEGHQNVREDDRDDRHAGGLRYGDRAPQADRGDGAQEPSRVAHCNKCTEGLCSDCADEHGHKCEGCSMGCDGCEYHEYNEVNFESIHLIALHLSPK